MQHISRLWSLAILISGILLAATDLPLADGVGLVATLCAAGFLTLLVCWRDAPAWIRSMKVAPPPASRVTIRIRCSR